MSADDTTLTPASRTALAHYRKRAEECRIWIAWLTRQHRSTSESRTEAATWDALADELEAFGETTGEHHDGQGELL